MVLNNVKGFDGPYEAPLKLPTRKVLKSWIDYNGCLLYTSPSPRDAQLSRMPSSA